MRIKRKDPIVEKSDKKEDIDLSLIDPLLEKYKDKKGAMIPILQGVQELFGYLPKSSIIKISKETGLNTSDIYGVATFYAQFRLNPVGKNIIKVCHGTACHVQNADSLTIALSNELKIPDGGTTEDNMFTLESVACLGCCSLAPVMMIGEETYAKLSGTGAAKIIRKMRKDL